MKDYWKEVSSISWKKSLNLAQKRSLILVSDCINFSESESESDSDDSNDSEYDEDIMLAREILAGKSSLYRENEINEIPDDLPALGRSKPLQEPINVGGKQTKEDNIGSRIMESQEKRIYHRCISALGDVNFRHAYK